MNLTWIRDFYESLSLFFSVGNKSGARKGVLGVGEKLYVSGLDSFVIGEGCLAR